MIAILCFLALRCYQNWACGVREDRQIEEDAMQKGVLGMKRIAQVAVFLLLILSAVLLGHATEIGAKIGIQTPSVVIQADWDVTPNVTVGLFLEPFLGTIANPGSPQTPSLTIGVEGKYQVVNGPFVFKPYLGLSGGIKLQLPLITPLVDVLVGGRIHLGPSLYLFAEAAFSILPVPNPATWSNIASWYKNLYLGFAFWV